jgi:hypothetical protein
MRTLGLVGAIGLVVGLGVPAFAGDKSAPELFALSQVSTVQTMTDTQLNSVEGMSVKSYHGGYHYGPIDQWNKLNQLNLNEGCGCVKSHRGEVEQQNGAGQSNNVFGRHGAIDQANWAGQANVNFGGHFVDQTNMATQANNVR